MSMTVDEAKQATLKRAREENNIATETELAKTILVEHKIFKPKLNINTRRNGSPIV